LLLAFQKPHSAHADSSTEIARLQLAERCRKRAAETEVPLRQIFDDTCRNTTDGAALEISFPAIESSMYKRRRLTQPPLPSEATDAASMISGSRFNTLDGQAFFRGSADAGDNGTALLFATPEQLELIRSATSVYFDATFKVVPTPFYQLFTLFVPHGDSAFPCFFALMSRKTKQLYIAIFEKLRELVPTFQPTNAMADFEEAPADAFRSVFGSDTQVSGCWFHFAQAIIRRTRKLSLTTARENDSEVKTIINCLMALPLLPAPKIAEGLRDIRSLPRGNQTFSENINRLLQYVERQWLKKSTIGPDRLSVRDNVSRTNNILESFHSVQRRRIQVSHPNLFAFLGHLQRTTTDNLKDVGRIDRGLAIRRPKKKMNIANDARVKTCMARFDSGAYTIIQFLKAASHCVDLHSVSEPAASGNENSSDSESEPSDQQASASDSSTPTTTSSATSEEPAESDCDVCLIAPRDNRIALVPCGHSRFCVSCAERVHEMGSGCPICRSSITMLLRIF